jgi:hypothetical protein
MLIGMALAAPALVSAQVSLATVVDLAQRNSSAVRLAQADVHKANAALSQTKDVYIPSLTSARGFPRCLLSALPGRAIDFERHCAVDGLQPSPNSYIERRAPGSRPHLFA